MLHDRTSWPASKREAREEGLQRSTASRPRKGTLKLGQLRCPPSGFCFAKTFWGPPLRYLCAGAFSPPGRAPQGRGAKKTPRRCRKHPGARTTGGACDRSKCSASREPGYRALAQPRGRDPAHAGGRSVRAVVLGSWPQLPGIVGWRGPVWVRRLAAAEAAMQASLRGARVGGQTAPVARPGGR